MLAFVDELVPLYPVYALLFAGAGMSGGQISALLALWSLTAFGLEVPSGALADRVSRRHVLAAAALVRTLGFVVWMVWPTFEGFAAGFVLWGAGSALSSGTWEALVYDELVAVGATSEYARLVGRAEVASAGGVIAGTALAGPLVGLGGYEAAGWASIAIGVLATALPMALPASRPATSVEDEEVGPDGYLATLRAGVIEAGRQGPVRRAVVTVAALTGITAVEEYVPLLTTGMELASATVPLVLLLPAIAVAIGAELSGRLSGISPRRVAALVAVGAALVAVGALVRHPAGLAVLAVGYGAITCCSLVAGARLQDAITGPRATVTSVAGFGTEVVALAIFAGAGSGSGLVATPGLVAATMLPLLAFAVLVPRWLPAAPA